MCGCARSLRPPYTLAFALDGAAPRVLVAPLPLLIALAGLIGIAGRPSQRWLLAFVAVADVWWCAATLFSKPLLLVHEALLEPTAVAYWLMVIAAAVPPLAALALLPRR